MNKTYKTRKINKEFGKKKKTNAEPRDISVPICWVYAIKASLHNCLL